MPAVLKVMRLLYHLQQLCNTNLPSNLGFSGQLS